MIVLRRSKVQTQAILFRGAGLGEIWPQFLALSAIDVVFFAIALNHFRKTISQMAGACGGCANP